MNKDIESRLKELRLTVPSPELSVKVLSNARAAWRNESEGPILHMQFRRVLALAASIVLFISGIALLNRMEDRHMRLALGSMPANKRISTEFLKEIGIDAGYGSLIAVVGKSPQVRLTSVFERLEKELKM